MNEEKHDHLDQLLDGVSREIRDLELDEREVAQATDRVWEQLRPESEAAFAVDTPDVETYELSCCEDYQALMPALVAGTLPPGRDLLVEDHARQCIPCRKALHAIRSGRPIELPRSAAPRRVGRRSGVLAVAATFLIGLLGGWFSWTYVWPSSQDDLFQIRSMEGQLFEVSDAGMRPLELGDWIDGRTEVRTAKGGGARIELDDGSLVEMAERSSLEVVSRRRGSLIRVERGSIIVEAAKQASGTLDVSTDEVLVSVKGTIFAVSHGSKGSRVSVIEGEVEVEHGRQRTSLFPGEQIGTRATLTAAPLAEELGWSQNFDHYLAILEDFREIRQGLSQVMEAEPRYSTQLLDLAPADTFVYVALPNPTSRLTEVYQLIRERVGSNPMLATWWQEVEASEELAHLDDFVADIQELAEYLGEETVVTLHGIPDDDMGFPVVMSEVSDATGLRAALEAKLAELSAEHEVPVTLLDGSTTMVNEAVEQLFVWIGEDLLVAADSIAEIHRIANGTGGGFAGTAFHSRVAEAYAEGAEYLGAVDLATIFGHVMAQEEESVEALELSGFSDVQFLVVERRQDGDRAHTAADLSFAGPRTGIAAWIAAPGPMGALEFFSPDATLVTGFVAQDPASILDEIFDLAASEGGGEDFEQGLAEAQAELGFDIRDDLIATLGGESAFGIDGPALPKPSWKAVVEVYDAQRLQWTLEQVALRINQEQTEANVTFTSSEVNGRTYYRLAAENASEEGIFDSAELHYTYVGGYLVAGPSQTLVERAIQYRDSGSSVLTSEAFQALLPTDGYLDFSAVVYNRIGEALSSVVGMLPMPDGLNDDQQQQLDSLVSEFTDHMGASLYCLYGDDDRIRLVSNSPTLMPFAGVESMFGLGALMSELDVEALPWQ